MDWTEDQDGVDRAALDRAVRLVAARGGRAHLCVLHGDRVLLDRCFGCRPDALYWLFSTSKPFVALLVHRLAERGLLRLDEPVVRYWPEFAARGKDRITVRHVLAHRAGLPLLHHTVAADALAMTDGRRYVRDLQRARPRWPAGLRARAVPVRTRGRTLPARIYLNLRAVRSAPIPAAGVSATARDVALFYRMLLRGGELAGTRVLAADSIAAAREPSTVDGELDRLLRVPVRWAHGFQLGAGDTSRANPLGRHSDPGAFGHNGSNCCLAWADPSRDLVFVHLGNLLTAGHEGASYLAAVSDAVLAAVDGARRIGGRDR